MVWRGFLEYFGELFGEFFGEEKQFVINFLAPMTGEYFGELLVEFGGDIFSDWETDFFKAI